MIEIIFTRPLTIYNSSEPINSALFSRAKPLLSPRLVKLNSFNFDWKRCNTSKGFRALFVYCICSKNDSFLSVFSLKSCVPVLHFFFFRLSIMCRRVFTEDNRKKNETNRPSKVNGNSIINNNSTRVCWI